MVWPRIFNSIEELNHSILSLPNKSVIVYTYGAWDILHPGHVKFLIRARELGDFLVVGVVADKPIKNLKGEDRPIQSQDERMFVIGSLACVDAAIFQSEYDPSHVIKSLHKVDILTKGDDWDYIPGQEAIEEVGGSLVKLGYSHGFSTTSIVSKISGKEVEKKKEF